MIYDLIVVGNGLAAKTFLFELFSHLSLDVKKSQNFSVAQVFSEEIAASCSLRSTASVSLSGIEAGISALGDDLRNSFYLFEDFIKNHNPSGVQKCKQLVLASNSDEKEKLLRRYKNCIEISSPFIKTTMEGVQLDSYVVSPDLYNGWFDRVLEKFPIDRFNHFMKNFSIDENGIISCSLMNNDILKAHKIVLCTGAYAKIFSHFNSEGATELAFTQVVAGAYLEKSVDLACESFYITLDGHNLIYRQIDQKLIMGSASVKGNIVAPDLEELSKIYECFSRILNRPLGHFHEFRAVTGLRHKGRKRAPIACALNVQKSVFMISGFYKNGYSLGHLCAKRVLDQMLSSQAP